MPASRSPSEASFDRIRDLLLVEDRLRVERLTENIKSAHARLDRIPEALAEDIERSNFGKGSSRFSNALSEMTAASLEHAVRRRPQSVVEAIYPVIGPAIRRSLAEVLRHTADDLDHILRSAIGLNALRWRVEAWRTGIPYTQVVIRHTTRFTVEHLFLIQASSGLVLGHVSGSGVPSLDKDAVAGMFTAIDQFVRDSVFQQKDEGGIASATVGEYRLVACEGPDACLVAFVRGAPPGALIDRMRELVEELHLRHGKAALSGAVNTTSSAGLLEQAFVADLNDVVWARPRRRVARSYLLAIGGAAIVCVGIYLALQYRWQMQVNRIESGLARMPGLVVLRMDPTARNRIVVEGLKDPLAADPREWIAREFPQVEQQWTLGSFVSMDPSMVRLRVAQELGMPVENVGMPDHAGVVPVQGTISYPKWAAAMKQLGRYGESRIDAAGLRYPEQSRAEALIRAIESRSVRFPSGSAVPQPGSDGVMAGLATELIELERVAGKIGAQVRLRVHGQTDEPGGADRNLRLRVRRAEWLAERLLDEDRSTSRLEVDLGSTLALSERGASREARVRVELVPVVKR